MQYHWKSLLTEFEKKPPASDGSIAELIKTVEFNFPIGYLDVMREMNGGEGPIGDGYLQLWAIEDLLANNKMYDTSEFIPGYFIFGTNLGGTAYAFEKSTGTFTRFEFVDMGDPQPLGTNMAEFLQSVAAFK